MPRPSISTVWPRSSAARIILRIRSFWFTAFFVQVGLPAFLVLAAPLVFPVAAFLRFAELVPRSDRAPLPSAGRLPSPAPVPVLRVSSSSKLRRGPGPGRLQGSLSRRYAVLISIQRES